MISYKALTRLHKNIKLRRKLAHVEWRLKQYDMTVKQAEDIIRRSKGAPAFEFDFALTREATNRLAPLLFVEQDRIPFSQALQKSIRYQAFHFGPEPIFRLSCKFLEYHAKTDQILQSLKPAIMQQCAQIIGKAMAAWNEEGKKYKLEIPEGWR